MTFDDRITATLTPAPLDMKRSAKDQVQTDSVLKLDVRGPDSSSTGSLPVGMSQRRDAYLPFVIFTALIGAAPLRPTWTLVNWAIGVVVILLVACLSTCLLVEFLALQIPGLSAPSSFWAETIHFLFERWLTPPGNRVVAPLILTALLCAPHFRLPLSASARLAEHPRNAMTYTE
jgi:hypothetical protein